MLQSDIDQAGSAKVMNSEEQTATQRRRVPILVLGQLQIVARAPGASELQVLGGDVTGRRMRVKLH